MQKTPRRVPGIHRGAGNMDCPPACTRGAEAVGRAAWLFGELDATRFSDDRDADLSRILQLLFNSSHQVPRQQVRLVVIDLIRSNDDAQFPASLHGEAL